MAPATAAGMKNTGCGNKDEFSVHILKCGWMPHASPATYAARQMLSR